MRGLAIISGVNYSGKGEVVQILRSLWDEYNLGEVEFVIASEWMMRMIGVKSHDELAAVGGSERNKLRKKMCEELAVSAQAHPVFLDTHFVFEDGERPEFDDLMRVTREIILVQSNPEMILERVASDKKKQFHPGRSSMSSTEFIISYIRDDKRVARLYSNVAARVRGVHDIPMLEIMNGNNERDVLRNHIEKDIFPQIVSNLEGFNPTMLEHPPSFLRMRR